MTDSDMEKKRKKYKAELRVINSEKVGKHTKNRWHWDKKPYEVGKKKDE